MGCTSSSPAAAASAADPATRNRSSSGLDAPADGAEKGGGGGGDVNGNGGGRKREKKTTADTECMTSSSAAEGSPSPLQDTFTKSSSVTVGNMSIRYACLSKRGRDPDDATKPNQDCFGEHGRLFGGSGGGGGGGDSDAAFFAVYDGHGPKGDACSQYVKKRLPKLVKKHIEWLTVGGELSTGQVQAALHDAHLEVNSELRASSVDDMTSGTTSVALFVHDSERRVTVSNVGDSRAVLGTKARTVETKSGVQAVPLSNDHTPYRKDEAWRCVSKGARILSLGEIDPSPDDDDEEEVEDPPRVWAQDGKYPGTAFTRSIGDAIAEKFGVFAEPEMITLKISEDEKMVVLCSDGVFDVMSNQEVIDMCMEHEDDPLAACSAVVSRSHEEWLKQEDWEDEEGANYDDMTIVCVFFNPPADADAAAEANGGEDEDKLQIPPQAPVPRSERKRVRQKTLTNLEEMGRS